jgi:hypothetical protein
VAELRRGKNTAWNHGLNSKASAIYRTHLSGEIKAELSMRFRQKEMRPGTPAQLRAISFILVSPRHSERVRRSVSLVPLLVLTYCVPPGETLDEGKRKSERKKEKSEKRKEQNKEQNKEQK